MSLEIDMGKVEENIINALTELKFGMHEDLTFAIAEIQGMQVHITVTKNSDDFLPIT